MRPSRLWLATALALLLGGAPSMAAEIHDAAAAGNLAEVREILAKSPQLLNAPGEYNRTPLITAVMSRRMDVVNYLLDAGAEVSARDQEGMTALHMVCFLGQTRVAERMLGKWAGIDDQENVLKFTPLHAAVRGSQSSCVTMLLGRGARPNLRSAEGFTPMLQAAWRGDIAMVRVLLTGGASLTETDPMGNTALHLAALNNHPQLVELLLARKMAVNTPNQRGGTAASIAAREGHTGIVQMLQAAGAPKTMPPAPVLQGAYLGQKPPGNTPKLFAPGVVSTEKRELNSVFTPDGNEFLFTVQTVAGRYQIMTMKRQGNRWSRPGVVAFSGTYSDADPFITADGRQLYFCSNRPKETTGSPKRHFDIWVATREGDGWSAPREVGAPVNTIGNEFYPTLTRGGTLYLQAERPDARGLRDIYRAPYRNGAWTKPQNLGEPVNSYALEGDALIAPDESYLILSVTRPGGAGLGDLWISRRNAKGGWSPLRNLGRAVNTAGNEQCPALSPDGRYLFFTRDGDIYWVDARILNAP
ncbi:MAG TPA: ankyrin repeat domain-containing protein [Acidobacteriota bacterium]|jgi:ankyrin repeat protein|nr:ankyrin repeat domain-containing protein [Acidobacteriota bacterium]HNU01358.1 ankyrin repeat domain-containing protein [Acidobacteriota bacterium]HPB27985.1 ankyrin repeat domain-containing protein [Acidobacteriota bacterium]HQO27400.1 ankyrin repeat domain-containing protein [Acidobacteriota bacterium]HQP75070.1 ankyrin repeat domain-containing protein [Acidobacteriota bacterium]